MQAKPVSDHALVAICMAEVCHRAGFPEQAVLVQRDLQFLSDAIETSTGVLISVSTIKRLLNGQFSRLPQVATLDALVRFLGFPDWQHYRVARASAPALHPPRRRFVRLRVLLFISLLVLATLGLFAVIRVGRPGLANIGKAQFSAAKVTSNDLPNTVVFRYNIDSVTADSFFIQQSWDVHRKVRIYKQNYTLTDIYYEPGYHVAKLIANDRIIKTIDVSIPTDRWFFYSKDGKPRSQPAYMPAASGVKDGAMQLTRDDLTAAGIDFSRQNEYCAVYFPSRIEGSSDNFVLKCRIRMAVASHASCPLIMPEVFCQRYFMYFQTAPKGCTSELTAQFGDNKLSGKTHDLSSLGSDPGDWQNMEFAVRNDSVDIRINGTQLLSTVFHKSCGLITGLGFMSNGLTAVDSVDLRTTDGKVLYHNDFLMNCKRNMIHRTLLLCLLLSALNGPAQTADTWNHKQCAVVLTYDDAIDVDLDNVVPALDSMGFKATFYLIGSSPTLQKRMAEWRTVASHGHELGNHSLFHPCDGSLPGRSSWIKPDRDLSKYTIGRAVDEIRATNTMLYAIDGKPKRTFAYPCGETTIRDSAFYPALKNDFAGARGVQSKMEELGKIDLSNIGAYGMNGQTGQQMIALVKEAMQKHTLLVFLFHGVGGGHNINVGLSEHSHLLHYLKDHESEIWIAPMVDVAEYIKVNQKG